MNRKYIMLKFLVGILIIGYLFYHATKGMFYQEIIWVELIVAIVLFFILIKWAPFTRKKESTWAFVMVLVVTIPVNLRMAYGVADKLFVYLNFASKFIYGYIFYLSFLAVEEIIFGIITRIIWRKQKKFITKANGNEHDVRREKGKCA